jgi:hypothetical protein
MLASAATPEQVRGIMRDLSNREMVLQSQNVQGPKSREEDRADRRAAAMRRTLIGIAAAGLYLDHRRRR